jgi:hypothetical protein
MQRYYECTQKPVNAIFAALGIAASNASLLTSLAVLFFLWLVSKIWNEFIVLNSRKKLSAFFTQDEVNDRLYLLGCELLQKELVGGVVGRLKTDDVEVPDQQNDKDLLETHQMTVSV